MSTLSETSPEELACRAQAGSLPAFEELVRRYQVPLLHFMKSRTKHIHEAEDLVQETLLKAYCKIGDYRKEHSFRAWIFTIAHRLMISRFRSETLRSKTPPRELAGAACPSHNLEAAETRETLWSKAREVLSEEQFTLLWLHYVENLGIAELARVLDRTRVTVKVQMYRSRKILARHVPDPLAGDFRAGGSDRLQRGALLEEGS